MIKCYYPGIVPRYMSTTATLPAPPDVRGSGTRIAETYVSFNDIWDVGTIRLGSPEPSRLGSSLLCGLVQRTMGYTMTGTDSD